jgi:cysteine-rich repeat protein
VVEATDTCPGNVVSLGTDQNVVLQGTTEGATDDYTTFCADTTPEADAADVVYQLEITAACTLTLDLQEDAGFDAAISFRRGECDVRVGGDDCSNLSTSGETFSTHALPDTYFVVIDGVGATKGSFTLTVSCDAPACQDGVVNPGEDCDEGPDVANDGCSATCEVEAQAADDTCDGTPVAIAGGETLFLPSELPLFSLASAESNDDYIGTCMTETGGNDHVFHIQPSATGVLTVITGQNEAGTAYCQPPGFDQPECIDRALYLRDADCEAGIEQACANTVFETGVTTLTANVTAGEDYFLFVDGFNAESYANGPYLLTIELE